MRFCTITFIQPPLTLPMNGQLKIALSVKREWLADMWPELLRFRVNNHLEDSVVSHLFPEYERRSSGIAGPQDESEADLKNRPVVELPLLGGDDPSDLTEQTALYEIYRAATLVEEPNRYSVSATPFQQLPPRILPLLDRPLIIKMFAEHYANQPIPITPLRSRFIQEIVQSQLSKVARGKTRQTAAGTFLENLAFELMRNGKSSVSDRELLRLPGYDEDTLERIRTRTFYLSTIAPQSEVLNDSRTGFSSDLLADFFCGQYLVAECRAAGSKQAQYEYLVDITGGVYKHGFTTRFQVALAYVTEYAISVFPDLFKAIWDLWSANEPLELLQDLVTSTTEYIRSTYGLTNDTFSQTFLVALAAELSPASIVAWTRLLRFAERLGDQGTPDALRLLDSCPEALYFSNLTFRQDLLSLKALMLFRKHDVQGALNTLGGFQTDVIEPALRSRVSFVRGRCLQFLQRYSEAHEEFEEV